MSTVAYDVMDSARAAELVRILDLHARWEGLRDTPAADDRSSTLRLQTLQKAFEAYRSSRAEYTARYKSDRIPELSPSGPDRLAAWCRTVRAVLQRAEAVECPGGVVSKAHRMADRIAARVKKDSVGRGGTPDSAASALRELDAVVRWCDELIAEGEASPVAPG